jgi:amphi-Trp domain-containing protein
MDQPIEESTTGTVIEVEKSYKRDQTIAKLRRLVEALESHKPFTIQIGGQRVKVPSDAEIVFEFEASDDENELEIEIKWTPPASR